ncbi:MAG: glycosyltransferase family 2 protein [Actinomycetota bacterium]|nr:glycosyltransferase family 2 protein [Actinomycetota bacterium]
MADTWRAGGHEPLRDPRISAVIVTHNRKRSLGIVLDRLQQHPVDEVIVFDNGSTDGTAEYVESRGDARVRVLRSDSNIGLGGHNEAARAASGDLLLWLDDDAYPLEGAVETLRDVFLDHPDLAVAGGFVIDVDPTGAVLRQVEVGTFDWFFRGGRNQPVPREGIPSFFFPEGACMVRREAFLAAGGYFAPFFFTVCEVDLTTRLVAQRWDVRYVPAARFEHMKVTEGRTDPGRVLHMRVRNQIWYFCRHFPTVMAARRIAAYLLFDLVECAYRGSTKEWARAIAEAFRRRDVLADSRHPLDRVSLRRAEMHRGRLHVRLLSAQLLRRLSGAAKIGGAA